MMLQAGKMAEIAEELLKYDLDITALQEMDGKATKESVNQNTSYYTVDQINKVNKVLDL